MQRDNRETILNSLKAAPKIDPLPRPELPPMREEAMSKEQMVEQFGALLAAQTGVLHRVNGDRGVLTKLEEVLKAEGVTHALASNDTVLSGLNLSTWGKEAGFEITTHKACPDRETYKKAAFETVQAGITGSDFAFAESGTLCLIINKDMPRLPSLAPILHIAVLPIENLVPTYEHMVDKVFRANEPPSQVVWITGPSMTADIQATPFKGMHGPQKLIVILRDA